LDKSPVLGATWLACSSTRVASCRSLVDAVEVRDTYTNEMRSHSHYPFSPLEQCSYS